MAKDTMIILRATKQDKKALEAVKDHAKDKSASATILRLIYEAYEKVKSNETA